MLSTSVFVADICFVSVIFACQADVWGGKKEG